MPLPSPPEHNIDDECSQHSSCLVHTLLICSLDERRGRRSNEAAWKNCTHTGSDSGIGQAIASTFAREGADVVVHYGHEEQRARATVTEVEQHGRRAEIVQADLVDPQNAQARLQQALNRLGYIDILVNNAGSGVNAETSLDLPLDEFIRVINIDLISAWARAQAAVKHMVEHGSGVMINSTSVHEELPVLAEPPTMQRKVTCAAFPGRWRWNLRHRACGSTTSHRA